MDKKIKAQNQSDYSQLFSKELINCFIEKHRLPKNFSNLISQHYIPLVVWLRKKINSSSPYIFGINGPIGTGKSTLADFIKSSMAPDLVGDVIVLSIDDFYFTKKERLLLSKTTHPLLITRGVPGTHDINLLLNCVDQLKNLKLGEKVLLPQFNKVQDDREPRVKWQQAIGPIDLIIVEGWCVASEPIQSNLLIEPINHLEKSMDTDGKWRNYVNWHLTDNYQNLSNLINSLLFLNPPNMEILKIWRAKQESKLMNENKQNKTNLMLEKHLTFFMQHFERWTKENLLTMPNKADIIFNLNEKHYCFEALYK